MTAPDPPAEATRRYLITGQEGLDLVAEVRAQVLAEVDAALRDADRLAGWVMDNRARGAQYADGPMLADYLRDTLTPDAGEAT